MSTLTDFNSIKLTSFPADQRDQIFAEHLLTLGKVERAKFLTRIIDSFTQEEVSALTKTMHSFKQDIEDMVAPATDAALVLEYQRNAFLRNRGLEVFQAIALARTQKRGISLSFEEVNHLTGYLHYQLAELLLPENPCVGDTELEVAICESRSLSNQDVRRLADNLNLPPLS